MQKPGGYQTFLCGMRFLVYIYVLDVSDFVNTGRSLSFESYSLDGVQCLVSTKSIVSFLNKYATGKLGVSEVMKVTKEVKFTCGAK